MEPNRQTISPIERTTIWEKIKRLHLEASTRIIAQYAIGTDLNTNLERIAECKRKIGELLNYLDKANAGVDPTKPLDPEKTAKYIVSELSRLKSMETWWKQQDAITREAVTNMIANIIRQKLVEVPSTKPSSQEESPQAKP